MLLQRDYKETKTLSSRFEEAPYEYHAQRSYGTILRVLLSLNISVEDAVSDILTTVHILMSAEIKI